MGVYRELHIHNLNKHKKFFTERIKFYHEQIIKINKELKRYEQESVSVRGSELRAVYRSAMVGVQSKQTDDQGGRK